MDERPRRQLPWPAIGLAAFGLAYYAYVRFAVDLYVYAGARPRFPLFSTRPGFLRDALSEPGGLVSYAAGALSLAYYNVWLGPLAVTLVAVTIVVATHRLIRAVGAEHLRALAVVPAAVTLPAYNLQFYQISLLLGIALVALFAATYASLRLQSDLARIGAFLALGCLLYYVAAAPFLVYGVLGVIVELSTRRSRLPGLVALLSIEAIPYVALTRIFSITLSEAFLRGLPLHPDSEPAGASYLLTSHVSLVLIAVGAAVAASRARRRAETGVDTERRPAPRWRRAAQIAAWSLLAAAWGGLLLYTYDGHARRAHRLNYYGRRARWEDVLREAQRLPVEYRSRVTCHHINRALFELGRLGDEMFCFAQGPETITVDALGTMTLEAYSETGQQRDAAWFDIHDLDLALGVVNEAEHQASEALAFSGEHPVVVWELAWCNVLKKRPEAARVLLQSLTYDPIYRRRAHELLGQLAGDPYLTEDPEVNGLRALMLTIDNPKALLWLTDRCESLLETNPRNRMAFEYLMAIHLLRRDLDPFVAELPRMAELGYDHIPRHFEEAILLYEGEHRTRVDRAGLSLREETIDRHARFSRGLAAARRFGALGGPAPALADEFGDTYYFYYLFGSPGPLGLATAG